MASTNDLKNGLVLKLDGGQLWSVVEFQHVKPGKGPAFVRTKLKHVMTGKVVDKTFNAGIKVDTATVDRREMTYLYQDGTQFVFMDGETYEQIHLDGEVVSDNSRFLLENRMLDHGAAGPSFESIVATGANSAVPHHRPTDAELAAGDLVKLDFGALVDGYHSDMTRTFVLGAPADWQRELYDLVAAAQAAGRAALRVGADVRDVDAAARGVVEAAGRGEEFLHGLGHGVGLEIHEAPALAKTGEGRLSAGMAVTVEPGVYLAGKGGVRIEDTLVVRDGDPELLTLTTKQLVVV